MTNAQIPMPQGQRPLNGSYKIALISAIAVCAFILVYYIFRGRHPGTNTTPVAVGTDHLGPMPTGPTMPDPGTPPAVSLPPGDRSPYVGRFPTTAPSPDAAHSPAVAAVPGEYVVVSGDTFERIATKVFHNRARAADIQAANPAVNPRRLKIGQSLRMPTEWASVTPGSTGFRGTPETPGSTTPGTSPGTPPRPTSAEPPSAPAVGGTYAVQTGDTLSTIARTAYHDPNKWRSAIYQANRSAIGDDPDDLPIGLKLTLPGIHSLTTARIN